MRSFITGIFICTFLISASAVSTRGQQVSLSLKNTDLKTAFDEIKKQTGYFFFYENEALKNTGKITIDLKNASITECLDACIKNQPITYTINNKVISIKAKQTNKTTQQKQIKGKVVDEKDQPLQGASIKVKGTEKQTVSNGKGEFYLENVDENAILEVSYLGYITQEVKAQPILTITLQAALESLQEVQINAGYYTVSNRERTGSISRVDSKTIGQQPVNNPLAALIGRMPGVNIEQQSGVNGGGFKVEIRGVNSLRAEARQPLYLVDGVPYPASPLNYANFSISNISQFSSPLNYISTYDIESIEVLKDADATAIYGSRGANGVILITTKKARQGKTAADFNVSTGLSTISKRIKFMNTEQYLAMRREAYANDGATPGATAYDMNGTWDQSRYTDWQEELIGGTARQNNFQAGFSGGNDLTQFSFRGNYLKQTTVYPGDFANQKGSGALTINHLSGDKKFNASFSTTYNVDKNNLPHYDLTDYINTIPNAPSLYDDKGSLNWAFNSSGLATWNNPLYSTKMPYKSNTGTLLANSRLSYTLLPGLNLISSLGYTDVLLKESRKITIASKAPAAGNTASSQIGNTSVKTWIVEPQLNYTKDAGALGKFDALIGTTLQGSKQIFEVLTGSGYTNDLLLDNFVSAPTRAATNGSSAYKYAALFSRINYNYFGKYLVNLTGRRDGSSRFGVDKKFVNFGAVGAAWILTEEKYIKGKLPWLSFGKLRGSYGITGSDQIPDYGYLETYSSTANAYGDGPALFPSRIANPDYSWETNRKLEAALEIGLFNDHILTSVNWYRNRSSSQLVGYPLGDIAGFPSVQYNLPATVQNTGWEFEINSVNIKNNKLTWTSNISFSRPKNKLLAYPGIEGSSYASTYTVGYSLYNSRAYQYLGVDPQTGLYTVRDLDGNGVYNALDRLPAGKDRTVHWYGGLQNSLSFKGFELNVFIQYVSKTSAFAMRALTSPGFVNSGVYGNQPVEVLDRWQKAGDNAKYQKFSQLSGGANASGVFNNLLFSADNYDDASFIRLKNVSLSWSLPQKWLKQIGVKSCRIAINGQNLFTITGYLGDPEIEYIKTLPTLRTVSTGLSVGF